MRDKRHKQRENGASRILILCDFDGTVSIKDTVNRLVRNHVSSPEWRFPVKQYLRGEIGSRKVYERIAPLMNMTRDDLEVFVQHYAELDPGFPHFLAWARERNIDVKIVSDGFDATIKTLFRNHGIDGIEIFTNRLILGDDGNVEMLSPHAYDDCGTCGTCKLQILRSFRDQYDKIILAGDGESDRHAAGDADMVLARRDLFLYCARAGIPAIRLDGFAEVPELLTREVKAVAFDMDGTLLESLGTITDSFNHLFRTLGYPQMTRDEVARKTCISLLDFVRSFLKPEEQEKGLRIFRSYYDTIYLDRTTMIPGALDCLEAIDGSVLTGVVTNKRGSLCSKTGRTSRFRRTDGTHHRC